MKQLKTYEAFSSLFKRKTDLEKLEKAYSKAKKAYEDMSIEAGGVQNLSKGVELGYDNFGDFTSACYDCVDILKDVKDIDNFDHYINIFNNLIDMCSNVNHVRGISEYSSSQLSFVKRNLILMKNKFK